MFDFIIPVFSVLSIVFFTEIEIYVIIQNNKPEVVNMAIHESGEDYLEAILMIKKRSGNVRSIDVARELSFSKPSVSVAM